MSNTLKSELVHINESLETIAHTLDTFGHDEELLSQMARLIAERDEILRRLKVLN